jgi:putative ABC transport system permease protein
MLQRPRFHKLFSDLWSNRTRSLLVVASITVGLVALGIIAIMYAVTSADMRLGFLEAQPANVQIQGGPFNQDVIRHVGRLPGVAQVEATQVFTLRLQTSPGEWAPVQVRIFPADGSTRLNRVVPLAGAWPPADRQIVLEQYKFDEANTPLGGDLLVELPGGKTRTLTLAGMVNDQTVGAYDTGPGFFLAPIQGYVTADTAEWLGAYSPGWYNTLYFTIQGDQTDLQQINLVAEQVRADLEGNGLQIASLISRRSDDHPNRVFVDALIGVLVLLGFLTLFLSGFLITNTLQALMKQQVQQIGIMKSLGARRNQIVALYLSLIFIYGLVAALISLPLAGQVAFQRVGDLASEINFIFRGPRLIPWALTLQAALAFLAPILAGLLPIIQGSRISVQQALSGETQTQLNPGKPGRLRRNPGPPGGWWARQIRQASRFPRPLLISLRNTFRHKARMVLTLITLSLGGAIFIASFNVQVSLDQYVERVGRYFLADVNLTLGRDYRLERVKQALAEIPGITHIEPWMTTNADILLPGSQRVETAQVLAPPAGSELVDPILLSGRWIIPGDQNAIAVNERFTRLFPELKPGDRITLRIEEQDHEFVVVGIYQLVGDSAGFIAYGAYEHFAELMNRTQRAQLFRISTGRSDMSRSDQEALGREIESALKANGMEINDIEPGAALSAMASDGFSILTAILLFLAILTALVGSIGLAGTMSMNVMERTREIGVMRAIGATDSILMRLVISEGLLIGLLSWMVGSLLAFPISKALSDSISQAIFGAPSTFGATPTGFFIWLAAVIVLSVLASVLPARSASRLTIREVLAYE